MSMFPLESPSLCTFFDSTTYLHLIAWLTGSCAHWPCSSAWESNTHPYLGKRQALKVCFPLNVRLWHCCKVKKKIKIRFYDVHGIFRFATMTTECLLKIKINIYHLPDCSTHFHKDKHRVIYERLTQAEANGKVVDGLPSLWLFSWMVKAK